MAMTASERWKRWNSKPENRARRAEYYRKRRLMFRTQYLNKEITYEDIPKSYRYFKA